MKFGHPVVLYFNYQSKYTKPWLTKAAEDKYCYKAVARDAMALSLNVEL